MSHDNIQFSNAVTFLCILYTRKISKMSFLGKTVFQHNENSLRIIHRYFRWIVLVSRCLRYYRKIILWFFFWFSFGLPQRSELCEKKEFFVETEGFVLWFRGNFIKHESLWKHKMEFRWNLVKFDETSVKLSEIFVKFDEIIGRILALRVDILSYLNVYYMEWVNIMLHLVHCSLVKHTKNKSKPVQCKKRIQRTNNTIWMLICRRQRTYLKDKLEVQKLNKNKQKFYKIKSRKFKIY